jgi:hypothetical protein
VTLGRVRLKTGGSSAISSGSATMTRISEVRSRQKDEVCFLYPNEDTIISKNSRLKLSSPFFR